jgi:hypothetical protein
MGFGARVVMLVTMVGCSSFSEPNHAPVVEPLTLSTIEDKGISFTVVATDEDGDDLALRWSQADGGSFVMHRLTPTREDGTTRIEAQMSLVPRANWSGDGGILVHVDDGDLHGSGSIAITITPVNDAPVGSDDRLAASADTPLAIFSSTLLGNDHDLDAEYLQRDPDELVVTAVDKPFRGSVSLAGETVTFVPETGFSGTASFEYTLSDGVATDKVSVMVDVAGPNAAPIAKDDDTRVMEDDILRLRPRMLTQNDIDHDGHALTVIAVGNATHGEVTVNAGVVTFVPEPFFFEVGGFDYTVTDGVATDTGHVNVEIIPWL